MSFPNRQPPAHQAATPRSSTCLWAVALVVPILAGCSNYHARVEAPKVSPKVVAQRLIESYDSDGDGSLSASVELEDCPSLAKNLDAYDTNSDGAVSLSEVRDRIAKIYEDRVAFYPLYARVTLNGRPLRGAHVKLAPEAAFGDTIQLAEGESDGNGYAVLSVAESDMPPDLRGVIRGVQTGLYRIHVEHASQSLPEKVVSGDHFGAEITSEDGNQGIEVAIESR